MKFQIPFAVVMLFCVNVLSLAYADETSSPAKNRGDATQAYQPAWAEIWMVNYYLNPEPHRMVDALRSLNDSGILDREHAGPPFMAFLSRLLENNPDQAKTIVERCDFLNDKGQYLLALALWQADTPVTRKQLEILCVKNKRFEPLLKRKTTKLLDDQSEHPAILDMCWSSFYATGKTEYLDKILSFLKYDPQSFHLVKLTPMQVTIYGSARWSLQANCRQHEKVLEHCLERISDKKDPLRSSVIQLIKSIVLKKDIVK